MALESAEVLPEMTVVYSEGGVTKRRVASKTTLDLRPEIELLSKLLPNHHQIHETEKSNHKNVSGSDETITKEFTDDNKRSIDTSKSFLKTRNGLTASSKINDKIIRLKSLMGKKEQK